MKYFVKIVRKSIKKNKNAGSMQTTVQGLTNVSAVIEGKLPEFLLDNPNAVIRTIEAEKDSLNERHYVRILSNELANQVYQSGVASDIIVDYNPITFNHFPIAKYSYTYENIKIKCSDCGKFSKLSELQSDFTCGSGDSGESYSNEICPKCGAWYCCELEYESIDNALKEIEIKK